MTNTEALKRWDELIRSRPAPVQMPATPTLDALKQLRRAMADAQAALRSLGVRDQANLTLGDVSSLLGMVSDS